jgi:peptide/nickel transport system permease protein
VGALIGRRLALLAPLLVVVSFSVFVLVSFMPGNPAEALAGQNPELIPYIQKSLHLDQPLLLRYWDWATSAIHGDLGNSWQAFSDGQKTSVVSLIAKHAPVSASLVGIALVLAFVAALVLGTLAAVREHGVFDRFVLLLTAFSIASPGFWLAYLGIIWFGVQLKWLPVLGYVPLSQGVWPWLSHVIMPAVVLAIHPAASMTLQLRNGLLEVFRQDYVLSAHAKGLSKWVIVWKHALKNAAVPVVTLLGYQVASLFGATAIIENVFGIPGLGTLAIQSTLNRDIPVLLGLLVCTTFLVVVANVLTDVGNGFLNPKLRTVSR